MSGNFVQTQVLFAQFILKRKGEQTCFLSFCVMLFINKQFQSENFIKALTEIILDVDISKQRYIVYNFHRALIEIESKLV